MPILNADYSNINYNDMASLIGLKPKHIPLLIASFLEESTLILASLQDAINSNNFVKINADTHSIKGSAGNLRFNEIYEMAKEMELSSENSDANFEYIIYLEAIRSAISTIKA